MTILVTGGAGFIGSHTAVELLEKGCDISIVDNFSNSHEESIKRIKEITNKDFKVHKVDMQNFEALDQLFEKEEIDAVIHFAGLKAVGESVARPLTYYRCNITSLLNLCEVMGKYDVKKLIFSSSATVYGNPKEVPIAETSPLSAENPYGHTKLMIEEILRDLHKADPSWRIAILRYFNPVGAHESGRIGESPIGVPNNLMPYISQVAMGIQEKLQIFGNDYDTSDGTGIRDYIHVTDLAKGHLKALQYLDNHEGIDAFNLGTGIGYSVLDLVNNFKEVCAKDIPYEITDRRPGDIGVCYANPEKAKTLLGWQTEKSVADMCRDAWNWQSQNPQGYV